MLEIETAPDSVKTSYNNTTLMNPRYQFVLLPILGGISAVASFLIARPFVDSLVRPDLPITDPAAMFTTGTQWDLVVHFAFGALVCGSFAFSLSAPRQGMVVGLLRGIFGAVLGGTGVFLSNSISDLSGIHLARSIPFLGGMIASIIWCSLVPSTISLVLALVVGWTPQRARRAVLASIYGFFATLVVQLGLGPIIQLVHLDSTFDLVKLNASGQISSDLRSGIPIWQSMDIAIGITVGILFAFAEVFIKKGSVKVIYGRNEFREWNLDHPINRIGSAERIEIPVRGFSNVAPVHAQVILDRGQFLLEALPNSPVFLNGQLIDRALLNHGDTVQMGGATLIFSSGSPSPIPFLGQILIQPAVPALQPFRKESSASPAQVVNYCLVDTLGNRFVLVEGTNTVGRDSDQMISLPWEKSVSRRHAQIQLKKGVVSCTDLGSTNGTRLNGAPIASGPVSPGDQLEFGCARATLVRE